MYLKLRFVTFKKNSLDRLQSSTRPSYICKQNYKKLTLPKKKNAEIQLIIDNTMFDSRENIAHETEDLLVMKHELKLGIKKKNKQTTPSIYCLFGFGRLRCGWS